MNTRKPPFWYLLIFILNIMICVAVTVNYFLPNPILPVAESLIAAMFIILLLRGLWILGLGSTWDDVKGNKQFNGWFSIISMGFICGIIIGVSIYLIIPNYEIPRIRPASYVLSAIIAIVAIAAFVINVRSDFRRLQDLQIQ